MIFSDSLQVTDELEFYLKQGGKSNLNMIFSFSSFLQKRMVLKKVFSLEDTAVNWDATFYYRIEVTSAKRLNFTRK